MTARRSPSGDAPRVGPPLIDTHVHYWDHTVGSLAWPWVSTMMTTTDDASGRLCLERYAAQESLLDRRDLVVPRVVHVQSAQTDDAVAESTWLAEMAAHDGAPDAIVAACSLAAPGAAALLERHARVAGVVGIRDMSFPVTFDRSDLAPALSIASQRQLSIEIRLPLEHFDRLATLAVEWPDVTFVLASLGLPLGPLAEVPVGWADALARLGQHPNWTCKVSGVIGRLGATWSVDRLAPIVIGAVRAFGAERAMYGTNWPVEGAVADLPTIVSAYREIANSLPIGDGHALCHGTAARVYGFDPLPQR